MRKTHKKILGFAGLGLVAATTAVAVTLPSPAAMAVGGVSTMDVIQVRVTHPDPEITVSTDSGTEGSSPNYSFQVLYDNVHTIKATLTNRDFSGNVIYTEEIWSEDLDWEAGQKTFNLDLNNYGGYGDFTIKIVGLGEGDVPVERFLTYYYTEVPEELEPDENGNVPVDIDVPSERVVTSTVEVFDESGNLVKTINLDHPDEVETLDFNDLPNGTYTLKITNKDQDGNIISVETRTIVVAKGGGSIGEDIEDVGQQIGSITTILTDSEGHWIDQITISNPTPGDTVNMPLSDSLPAGDYTLTTKYYDTSGNLIKTVVRHFTKTGSDGKAPVDIDNVADTVTGVETYIYDEDGNIVRILRADIGGDGTVNVYDKDGRFLFSVPNGLIGRDTLIIPMEGLPSGTYKGVIVFKNQYGGQVGPAKIVIIKYNAGGVVPVPDTGGFLQGLNISREDYLITGLVVFMVIGVVAFGVVAKSRRDKKTAKKNRR